LWLAEKYYFLQHWLFLQRMDFAAHMNAAQPGRSSSLDMVAGKGGKSVAVIRASGLLMKQQSSMGGTSTVQLRRDIRSAANDPNVSGILLSIDSPGGTSSGTADLAADVRAAARVKPVWAQIEDLGASAAYWLASQADQVFANGPTTMVGSIGTYQTIYDVSGAAEQQGVKALHFATGPLKGAGAEGTKVTEEQQAYFQGLVDAIQEQFDAAVRAGRGMNATQLAAVRTGGVFPAKEAQALKLIDGIQSFDKTLTALASAK
jgi:signal peptide peptidase SppA